MVTLPKQKVREVHLRSRFCAHYHFNTQNKGIAFVPVKIPSEGRSPSLPHTYRNIPHTERLEYRRNLSIDILTQLRREARKATYEEGVLEPYCAFDYQSSNSLALLVKLMTGTPREKLHVVYLRCWRCGCYHYNTLLNDTSQ